MLQLGEKIKSLRKQKNISQEVFANYLGVSFQAVSKWENGNTMPDVTMIPAIASFFGVSTDELFDFNLYETEKRVEEIVSEHSRYWHTDKKKAEQIIRDGLKKYPGNDILLNCLIGVLELPERSDEVISVAKALIESTKYDEVRFDAYRIMAEAYAAQGDFSAAKDAVEHIPEIYFTKLELLQEPKDDYVSYQFEFTQALGNGMYTTFTSLGRQMVVLLPVAYLMSLTGDVDKVWLSFPIAEVVSGALTVFFFIKIYRQKIKPLFG